MPAVIDRLLELLPAGSVLTGADVGDRHASDWTRRNPLRPLAVVRPASTEEVSLTLRTCHALRQPVVVQGGLTGLAGGATPRQGEIALSLERLNGVEAIDAAGGTLRAKAGTPLSVIHDAAEAAGLQFPLDLGARGSCTIGGNISTNAGGNRVIRYGMTRDLILGLEAVLADGTIVSSLNAMLKNNAGYDLKHLFIGSEGTLGVVTRAVVRLHAAPRERLTAFVGVDSFDALVALGCVIRGETYHFELVANESGAGVTRVSLDAMLPIANAILTVENEDQAQARTEEKARDAARVAIGNQATGREDVQALWAEIQRLAT